MCVFLSLVVSSCGLRLVTATVFASSSSLFFFFFKQKTAYEMRISDWSSDVCSSDLLRQEASRPRPVAEQFGDLTPLARSEERRVGKECVSTCRSRWSPYH